MIQTAKPTCAELSDLIDTAASTKDSPDSREQQLQQLLTALLATPPDELLAKLPTKLSSMYPRPTRSLLDATLQAFMAASPLNCSFVLPGLLTAPGSTSLTTPLRRDTAALFRPNPSMHSSWPQQGMVCCSIVACIATFAAEQMHALHKELEQDQAQQPEQQTLCSSQQMQRTEHSSAVEVGAQHVGTAVGWLTDCLVQAVSQHKLHLLKIALAAFVARYDQLQQHQQMEQQQQQLSLTHSPHEPAPKRRRRLQQHHEQDQGQPQMATTASHAALQAGLQLLCAVCSCGTVQNKSRQQLLPLAAVAAAQAAAGAQCCSNTFSSAPSSWLMLQLCNQVSQGAAAAAAAQGGAAPQTGTAAAAAQEAAAPQPSNAVAASSSTSKAAAGAGAGAAHTNSPKQQQQQQQQLPGDPTSELAAAGLTPMTAWDLVLQHVAAAGPLVMLHFVQALMGIAQPTSAAAAATAGGSHAPGQAAPGAGAAGAGSAARMSVAQPLAAAPQTDLAAFHTWLQEASKQWQQAASDTAINGSERESGGRGSSKAAVRSRGGKCVVTPLRLEQLLPPARHVTASWVCKQLLPCLCRQATIEWQQGQQQKQQQQPAGGHRAATPAIVALAQLFAADGLLLPASGEVLVSARALAEALRCLEQGLQAEVVRCWQQLLQSQQEQPPATATAAGGGGQDVAPLLAWATLQPMLCVLNHLPDLSTSPVARLLGRAACSCVAAAAKAEASAPAGNSSGSSSGSSSSSVTKDVLKHVLLPLRFKLQVPVRVWLMRQLLGVGDVADDQCVGSALQQQQQQQQQQGPSDSPGVAGQAEPKCTAGAHVLQVLQALLAGECSAQLQQGLQWLADQRGSSTIAAAAAAAVVTGAAGGQSTTRPASADLADTLVQLLRQLQPQPTADSAVIAGSQAVIMVCPAISNTLQAAHPAALQLLLS